MPKGDAVTAEAAGLVRIADPGSTTMIARSIRTSTTSDLPDDPGPGYRGVSRPAGPPRAIRTGAPDASWCRRPATDPPPGTRRSTPRSPPPGPDPPQREPAPTPLG